MRQSHISVRNASENNLRSVSLEIPKNQLVVVTGVSGSGKSSLVFDVIFREAERRYLATFSAYARQFLQKTRSPRVESVSGLSPAIAIDQHAITRNPRSTVGTLTEIYDYLRLLFARVGKPDSGYRMPDAGISRSLFSFNSPEGACPACKGLGVEDRLDPELLVKDPKKTLREGALVITAPNGYIIYSQVTLDVLNQVCEAEGFSVDIPWEELTPPQKHIILYGSEKIEVPYGKHPLESRMKWTGITAKPREMGFYKGVIPVMETILKRERNKNILRFVRTTRCQACDGKRLKPEALAVTIQGSSIADLSMLPMDELRQKLNNLTFPVSQEPVAKPIIEKISSRIGTVEELGLAYLTLDRESTTLSAGEAQRIRLAVQIGMELQGLLYILDEPSIGLHPSDSMKIIRALKTLRDKGNSVIVVEHEEAFIHHADHLIDIGPGAGIHGGEVVINCPVAGLGSLPQETIEKSQTLQYLFSHSSSTDHSATAPLHHHTTSLLPHLPTSLPPSSRLLIRGATLHNLKSIDVMFLLHSLNVVTGVSGAGKSSLVNGVLEKQLPGTFREIEGWDAIRNVIAIDQSPIGKTSRSNPATYTGLFDPIRDLFAGLPLSVERNYSKSRFSFNTAGGRCEACQGAGFHQTGMHFLGTVEVLCATCQGKQFDDETLEVTYRGKTIAGVLDLTITEAIRFFHDRPELLRYLHVLEALGLGYLHLGQRSSTLSGGEAQRVKLATELARPASSHTLYLLDEPTTGLHPADVARLLEALRGLVDQQHTVIVIEHHPALILAAGHIVDLGPGAGREGGTIVASGTPAEVMLNPASLTGRFLAKDSKDNALMDQCINAPVHQCINASMHQGTTASPPYLPTSPPPHILLSGVTTNNLKNLSCRIPHEKMTVITGVSGSGKSSLAFDTLYAEGRNRFLESFSAYARAQMGIKEKPGLEEASGLTPTFAVDQRDPGTNPRSTVGTYTGIYDTLRLLYARFGRRRTKDEGRRTKDEGRRTKDEGRGTKDGNREPVFSSLFSFNEQEGACSRCDGLGTIQACSPEKLVTHPDRSLLDGALDGTRTGRFYGEPFGQYVSTLKAAGMRHNIDFSKPWHSLTGEEQRVAMEGTGNETYNVVWQFKRKERTGEHHFNGTWAGFLGLVNQEYARKHADHRGEETKTVMEEIICPACKGRRLNPEALSYLIRGEDIATLSSYPVARLEQFLKSLSDQASPGNREPISLLTRDVCIHLDTLAGMGLEYISLDRPLDSLSGGEFQRIKLAGQMGSGLTGITYVLDEPTAGLHPVDTAKLLDRIDLLRSGGNTIVMVEHDPDVIRRADLVIDMGPGAGKEGGEIIATGTPEELMKDPHSVTGKYLNTKDERRRTRDEGRGTRDEGRGTRDEGRGMRSGIRITGATLHNLDHLTVELPAGELVAITGISGSGKSTLVNDVLFQSWLSKKASGCSEISGLHQFDRVISVNQKRHFRNSRGTPVTFAGIFDTIRDLFAKTPEAKSLGLKKTHFSFLNAQGGCSGCNGSGETRISMDFLADVTVVCEQCHGTRYRDEILQVRYNGKHISDILTMTFGEAAAFFEGHPSLEKMISPLIQIGLGYLILGQSLETLSGGEAQRLMLAGELIRPAGGPSLFLFDEPSSGLHPGDLPALLSLLDQLLSQGHSVIMIEHNPELILHAGWVTDLGPGPGPEGGRLVAQGTPEEIIKTPESLTGSYLSTYIGKHVAFPDRNDSRTVS